MGTSSNKKQKHYHSFNTDPLNFCIVQEQKFDIINNKDKINNNMIFIPKNNDNNNFNPKINDNNYMNSKINNYDNMNNKMNDNNFMNNDINNYDNMNNKINDNNNFNNKINYNNNFNYKINYDNNMNNKINDNNNLNQKINYNNDMNNKINDNIYYKDQINRIPPIGNEISGNNTKINDKIINKINDNENKNASNNKIGITFLSTDQTINYNLACNPSDLFSEVEKKLYSQYPSLANKDIHFVTNGNVINKNNTIEKNKIKHGNIILIIDNEGNEPIDTREVTMQLHFISTDQKINTILKITCKLSDEFINAVNRLYNEFRYLKDRNIFFTANGNVIDTSASFEKNKIKSETTILINETEKIILLHFLSMDQNINIEMDIACTSSDDFSIILEKLYSEFPYLKEKIIYFLMNGNIINQNATIGENKIKDDCQILIYIRDE